MKLFSKLSILALLPLLITGCSAEVQTGYSKDSEVQTENSSNSEIKDNNELVFPISDDSFIAYVSGDLSTHYVTGNAIKLLQEITQRTAPKIPDYNLYFKENFNLVTNSTCYSCSLYCWQS